MAQKQLNLGRQDSCVACRKANIDHIALSASGVYVIDVKKY